MGAVIGLPVAYFVHKFLNSSEGKFQVVKEFIAYLYVIYLRWTSKRRCDFYDYSDLGNAEKIAFKIPKEEWRLECPRKDLDFSLCTDTIQFYGVNSKKDNLFVRISKISQDLSRVWLQLKLANGKRYELPVQREWRIPMIGEDVFAGGGLRIRCLAAMRKWRISFNGMLQETDTDQTEIVHVKFNFVWTASSMLHDLSTDISPRIMAKFLAKQKWGARCLPDVNGVIKYLDSYDQAGNMYGGISVRGEDEKEVNLWGGRQRSVEIHDLNSPTELLDLFGYMKDGECFHVGSMKFPNLASRLNYGFVLHSNGIFLVLDDYELTLPNCNREKMATIIQTADVYFKKGKQIKKIHFGLPLKITEFLDAMNPKNLALVHFSPVLLDDERGYGVITSLYRSNESRAITVHEKKLPTQTESGPLVVGIDKLGCNDCHLAGGKGASLGELTAISRKDTSFSVPNGVVLTTSAYEVFLESSTSSRKNIALLNDVACGKAIGVIQDVCQSVVSAISREPLPGKIQKELRSKLQEIFSQSAETLKFAVRSSATGEDSEEMSSAGQMDTLLGIQGFEEITNAVVKCWASQFSFTAVQYKRQYGQVLNSPMAVVVQQMIPADAAGVIFTCDPLTGNPETIIITANYGIGESVVSASADPDTIVLKRDITGTVKLQKIQMGQKKTKVVISESGRGVESKTVDSSEAENCCLQEKMATALAEISIKIEEAYAQPVDIEWAVKDNKVYLLQARPVTTFDKENEREIILETNTSLRSEDEYTTIANVGEVMPGAMSPLSYTQAQKTWDLFNNIYTLKRNPNLQFSSPYYIRVNLISHGTMMINVLELLLRFYKKEGSIVSDAYVIACFGRVLDDEEMLDAAAKRSANYPNIWQAHPLLQTWYVIRSLFTVEKCLQKATPFYKRYRINLDNCHDSQSIFDRIVKSLPECFLVSYNNHINASMCTSIWNICLLNTLKSSSGNWNTDVFTDISTILSSISKVESADVPFALQNISSSISKCIDPSVFRLMTPEAALKWLKDSDVSNEFNAFLDNHGHRCVKEFDMYTKPWGHDPLPLVKLLQEMVGRVQEIPESKSQTSLLKMNVKLSWFNRLWLRFLTPFARRAVGQRERSKSMMIKSTHIAREAFLQLAKKMVEEGRIPDEELMFFVTFDELYQLLETRSPKIVQKAMRRRAIHPKLDKLKFPEIMKGVPKPINFDDEYNHVDVDDVTLTMKGIPVSRGTAKGPALVATTLEEAKDIRAGDILIAYSTDIGWSPYFPLLAGVSTELGGLISHGAVVAREYGLPCVVGVHGATRKFKTGDIVFLDGNNGVLQRIS